MAGGGPGLVEVLEAKGLDMVRRDWSMLAKDTGNYVLQQILSGGRLGQGCRTSQAPFPSPVVPCSPSVGY